jgi:hypothetical protein
MTVTFLRKNTEHRDVVCETPSAAMIDPTMDAERFGG